MNSKEKDSNLVSLVRQWETYCEQTKKQDLSNFAVWLQRNTLVGDGSTKKHPSSHAENFVSKTQEYDLSNVEEKEFGLNAQIALNIQRLQRLLSFYLKKAFVDLPISSQIELSLLLTIKELGSPTKSEVIIDNLVEVTTGTDVLKRLLRLGFITEQEDKNDKRSKRVKITKKGEEALQQTLKSVAHVNPIFAADLSVDQKVELEEMLTHLMEFHSGVYARMFHLNLEELRQALLLKKVRSKK